MIPSLYELCRIAIDKQLILQAGYLNEEEIILPTPFEQLDYTNIYEYDNLERVNRKRRRARSPVQEDGHLFHPASADDE